MVGELPKNNKRKSKLRKTGKFNPEVTYVVENFDLGDTANLIEQRGDQIFIDA